MLRDPGEIEISYLTMFQRRPPFVLSKYHEVMNATLERLRVREDTAVIPLDYGDVITDPLGAFITIKQHGFPITGVKKAAAAVNPALYRSQAGDLGQLRHAIRGLKK